MSDLYDPELLSALGLTPYDSEGEILTRLQDAMMKAQTRARSEENRRVAAKVAPMLQALREQTLAHLNPPSSELEFRENSGMIAVPKRYRRRSANERARILQDMKEQGGAQLARRIVADQERSGSPILDVSPYDVQDMLAKQLSGMKTVELQDSLDAFLGNQSAKMMESLEATPLESFRATDKGAVDPRLLKFRAMQGETKGLGMSPVLFQRLADQVSMTDAEKDLESLVKVVGGVPSALKDPETVQDIVNLQSRIEPVDDKPPYQTFARSMETAAGRRLQKDREAFESGNFIINEKGYKDINRNSPLWKALLAKYINSPQLESIPEKDRYNAKTGWVHDKLFTLIRQDEQMANRMNFMGELEKKAAQKSHQFELQMKKNWGPDFKDTDRDRLLNKAVSDAKKLLLDDDMDPRSKAEVARALVEEVSRVPGGPALVRQALTSKKPGDAADLIQNVLIDNQGWLETEGSAKYSPAAKRIVEQMTLARKEGDIVSSEMLRKAAFLQNLADSKSDPDERASAQARVESLRRSVESIRESGGDTRWMTADQKDIGYQTDLDITDDWVDSTRYLNKESKTPKNMDNDVWKASLQGQAETEEIGKALDLREKLIRGGRMGERPPIQTQLSEAYYELLDPDIEGPPAPKRRSGWWNPGGRLPTDAEGRIDTSISNNPLLKAYPETVSILRQLRDDPGLGIDAPGTTVKSREDLVPMLRALMIRPEDVEGMGRTRRALNLLDPQLRLDLPPFEMGGGRTPDLSGQPMMVRDPERYRRLSLLGDKFENEAALERRKADIGEVSRKELLSPLVRFKVNKRGEVIVQRSKVIKDREAKRQLREASLEFGFGKKMAAQKERELKALDSLKSLTELGPLLDRESLLEIVKENKLQMPAEVMKVLKDPKATKDLPAPERSRLHATISEMVKNELNNQLPALREAPKAPEKLVSVLQMRQKMLQDKMRERRQGMPAEAPPVRQPVRMAPSGTLVLGSGEVPVLQERKSYLPTLRPKGYLPTLKRSALRMARRK